MRFSRLLAQAGVSEPAPISQPTRTPRLLVRLAENRRERHQEELFPHRSVPTTSYKVSQILHVNFGGAWPGSTITELDSPQRPHFRTSLVGNLIMGLLAVATACSPRARSSA